jgi:hypothetical protein
MKRFAMTALLLLSSTGVALAGASSENKLDPRSQKGPEGQGAYSSDPGNTVKGSETGPSGPTGAEQPSGAGTGAATGAGGAATTTPGAGSASGEAGGPASGSTTVPKPGTTR